MPGMIPRSSYERPERTALRWAGTRVQCGPVCDLAHRPRPGLGLAVARRATHAQAPICKPLFPYLHSNLETNSCSAVC
eukprot:365254-Chlamydomonas_euryale.AAC.8